MPRLQEWPQSQLLAAEKELLGFYVTGHPLTPYASLLEQYCLCTSLTAKDVPARTLTRLGGLITAVQQGISKKTNKPYLMATLEDLAGAVSMLVMNENYDKFRELITLNRALMVVGEINNSEDKPKIFPQEIMPLEEAPRRYTRQVHLRLHTAHLTPERLEQIHAVVSAHPGKCPLFLCFMQPGGQVIFIESHERFAVAPGPALQKAIDDLLGEDTYFAKIDTSLPERAARRWERRPDSANGDESAGAQRLTEVGNPSRWGETPRASQPSAFQESLPLHPAGVLIRSQAASVAQLDRASDFGSEGCRFKSCRTRQAYSKRVTKYPSTSIEVASLPRLCHYFGRRFLPPPNCLSHVT